MDSRDRRFATLLLFVLFVIAADVSMLQSLAAANTSSDVTKESPSPSPDPLQTVNMKRIDNTTAANGTKGNDKSSSVVDSKGLNGTGAATAAPPPPSNETQEKDNSGGEKESNYNETKKKDGEKTKPDSQQHHGEVARNCTGVPKRCRDRKSLVACIPDFETGSKQFVVVVQNDGEEVLSVDVSAPNSFYNQLLEIPSHSAQEMNITAGNGTEVITLKAGNGACTLHMDSPVSPGNFFLNLPSYNKLITPINGAYFLILTVLVFGGTWACCMFRKKRRHGGIPYQELEMGLPESNIANNVESAEGWEQDWDDDWDEENAVKSPAARHAGSVSANGLTSRAANKDGWEKDWDD